MRKYYIMKLNTTVIIIAVIALVLFVYYMASSGSIEMFQEGAAAMTEYEKILKNNAAGIPGSIRVTVGDKKMLVTDKIRYDIEKMDRNTFSNILVNGNIQIKSNEYNTFINAVKSYISVGNVGTDTKLKKEFTKKQTSIQTAAVRYANAYIYIHGLKTAAQQATPSPATTPAKQPLKTSSAPLPKK